MYSSSITARRRLIADTMRGTGYDVFFNVPLADLTREDGERAGETDPLRFSCLICREGTVAAAANPFRLSENGGRADLGQEEREELAARVPGLPLAFLRPKNMARDLGNWMEALSRKSGDCCWSYEFQSLTQEEAHSLAARQMLEKARRTWWSDDPTLFDGIDGICGESVFEGESWVPTLYGQLQGLAEGYIVPPESRNTAAHNRSMQPAVGCTRQTREKLQAPWEEPQLWEKVPFEQRLERLRNGQPCNLGHMLAVAQSIADTPLSAFISHLKSTMEKSRKTCSTEENLRKKLGDLSMTYGQAAVKIDHMLRNQNTREKGLDIMWDLALCLGMEHSLKEGKK